MVPYPEVVWRQEDFQFSVDGRFQTIMWLVGCSKYVHCIIT